MSSSSRAGSDMKVDVPSVGAGAPPQQAPSNEEPIFLMEESQLRWKSRQGKDNFKTLKPHKFALTNVYDPCLLQATGMDTVFDLIFQVVGWEGFWNVTRSGFDY